MLSSKVYTRTERGSTSIMGNANNAMFFEVWTADKKYLYLNVNNVTAIEPLECKVHMNDGNQYILSTASYDQFVKCVGLIERSDS